MATQQDVLNSLQSLQSTVDSAISSLASDVSSLSGGQTPVDVSATINEVIARLQSLLPPKPQTTFPSDVVAPINSNEKAPVVSLPPDQP